MNAKYLIDTNIFVRFQSGQQYDKDCFPVHYKNFLRLLDEGLAISLDKVRDELDDDFFTNEYKDIFKPSISNEITDTYNLLRSKFPEYFNTATQEHPDDADSFLITYAYHHNMCIVTQDEFQSTQTISINTKEYNIPTLCEALEGICIDNKDRKENIGQYKSGFGCICLSELIRLEQLMK